MMKNLKLQISIGLVCMILGFFVVLQIKSVGRNNVDTYPNQVRLEQVQELLRMEKEKTEALYKQVTEYKDMINEYQSKALSKDSAAELLQNNLSKAEMIAGIAPVEGPGIEIKVEDSDAIVPADVDENLYVTHDEDIMKIINELRAAGAEAISLNGERLTSRTGIRCVGATVSVNNTIVAAPFHIRAIGNYETMQSALTMRGGLVDQLSRWIKIEIKKSDKIVIPSYKGVSDFKFARIITNQEASQEGTN